MGTKFRTASTTNGEEGINSFISKFVVLNIKENTITLYH